MSVLFSGTPDFSIDKTYRHDIIKNRKSRMDNPEILATLGTQDTGRKQTQTRTH